MSFLRKLFGSTTSAPGPHAELDHEGYHIAATPIAEAGQYRLCAVITKDVAGQTKTHRLIRADLFTSAQDASDAAIAKAKRLIAEQGEAIFG